ncbi:MAG: hypothetical protein C0499_06270 [Zymomonas sp.]|nr:hypothetical protein [Zymomonas sp.]MBA4210987.1 hypothetical protein [Parvibaculum sp.]
MAGRNQHHIPQFLQRGFAVAGSGGMKIWRFDTQRAPKKPSSIRSTGAEEYFYSEPSSDGSPTLDDVITHQENPLSDKLIELRSRPIGADVDPHLAAELVNHLAPRTAHLRQTLERGMRQLVSGAAELVTQQDKIERLLGLDKPAPTQAFTDRFSEELMKVQQIEQVAVLGLPDAVLERIAFQQARENFDAAMIEVMPRFERLFAGVLESSNDIARAGHNKALGGNDGPNARFDHLATLRWTLTPAPADGAILPDCVAVAYTAEGMSPLMFANLHDASAVAMPISSQVILVGTLADASPPTEDFNLEAARVSHRFFLSATNIPAIADLRQRIDERAYELVEDAVRNAFKDLMPPVATVLPGESDDDFADDSGGSVTPAVSWELSLIGMYDTVEAARNLTEAIRGIVAAVGYSLPLSRLEGITLSNDYGEALSQIDRGVEGVGPPSSIDPRIGTGIAQTVNVLRNGQIMCRIVLDSGVGFGLLSNESATVDAATNILIRQLMLASLTEVVDLSLPGVILQPIADPLQGWLYNAVGGALDCYVVSHMASGFGDSRELASGWRQLLTEALDRLRETVLPARLAYRYNGDLDALLAVTMPHIHHVLQFAGDLLGHCAAQGVAPVELGSDLAVALDRIGLKNWLPRYAADLETCRLNYGKWKSFDEFLTLNVHVERLMWQFGMIPWSNHEGMRVEVPLGTDAEALMGDALASQGQHSSTP